MLPLDSRDAGVRRACTARRASAPRSSASSSGCPTRPSSRCSPRSTSPAGSRTSWPATSTSRSVEAGAARDALGRGPAAPRPGPRPAPDRRALGAGRHPVQGQGRDRRPAARDVPARAAQGDPEGARRGRRARATRRSKELRAKLDALDLPEDARKEVDREWQRLTRIGRESMESQVIRTYLETIAELPWNERSDEKLDVPEAARILDEDHYGLEDVKDRILEFLAVRQLGEERESDTPPPRRRPSANETRSRPRKPKRSGKGRILLFAGPPGVGKTSIAKSIARAMGRKYVRISLGGARDEADIRGHRRTYIGAMPGRILQGMKQAGTQEPGVPPRRGRQARHLVPGRPGVGAARGARPGAERLLHRPLPRRAVRPLRGALHRDGELRPEHPGPAARPHGGRRLRRATPRRRSSRSRRTYLLPRQIEENGLAGRTARGHRRRDPRGDRELHARVRRAPARAGARQARAQGRAPHRGARDREADDRSARTSGRCSAGRACTPRRWRARTRSGVATGMYYTPAGGDIMFVEASLMRGKGELILTGQLGDVMKESARAAWTFARSHAPLLGIDERGLRAGHPHPRAGGRDPQGRAVGRHRDGDGGRLGPLGPRRPQRRRDDRRDHALRARPADRRAQGEDPRRRAGGHHADRDSERQRAGSRGPVPGSAGRDRGLRRWRPSPRLSP